MKGAYEGRTIANDMVDGCADVVGRETAVKAVRALCRHFGGSLIYIPIAKTTGDTIGEMRGVLCGAAGGRDGERILAKLMALFGAQQLYVPMEKSAFREEFAREIYGRSGGDKEKIRDLCREYGMSFTHIYRLWHKGRKLYMRREEK